MSNAVKVTTVNTPSTPRYVTLEHPNTAYRLVLWSPQDIENLVDDLLHHKWLWERARAKDALPQEDDEQDVNDFHGEAC